MDPLLWVRDLKKHFPIRDGWRRQRTVYAVDGVSFHVAPGETFGLVGESGCGKTTIGRLVLRLIEPTAGQIRFDGRDVLALDKARLKAMRRDMQMVFQNPYASLNPRLTAGGNIAESLIIHGLGEPRQHRDMVQEMLRTVGLQPDYIDRYPHEFSGGQRQRIGIARALAVEPDFIVADEPVSALDVSVQAQVVNLLQDLQRDLGLAILFIAHDLAVVHYISDRVVVVYLGRVMEIAPSDTLYRDPRHPYTLALLDAAPVPDPRQRRSRVPLQGDIPSPANPPSGCVFRTRCPRAIAECAQAIPPLVEVAPGHLRACIRDLAS
jgi:oligopeptide transport system ATP-binding protein